MSRFWIISDTHFGVRNYSKKWEDLMVSWMDDFFFPLVDREISEDDILVHLGDVFDNRHSICLSTMNIAIDFFEKAASRFKKIYVLCGNHDAYYTTKNDVTSIECLKYIPNVNVIKSKTSKEIFGKNVTFIPWTENLSVFKNVKKEKTDILFCHAEFLGCVMNSSGVKSENNLDIPNILHIYSGHIHHRQKYKNVTYVGSPYQLTQNDRNNIKGVWIYDPETNSEQFIYNNFSPEFLRMKYDNIKDLPFGEFKKICENCFVEIETDNMLMTKCQFQKLLSLLQNDEKIMDLSFLPLKKENKNTNNINISDCMQLSEMLDMYIDEYVSCDEITKKSIRAISKKLINE